MKGFKPIGGFFVCFVLLLFASPVYPGDFSKPFAKAVANGDIKALKKFLAEGADIDAASKDGETFLMIAALEARYEVVKFLIGKGADVNAKDSLGATPLLYAAQGGSLSVMRFLVEKGADITAATKDGTTALSISEMKNNHKAIKYLKGLAEKK